MTSSSSSVCRHFLFKTGTGSTPFFGAAAPGYTMATGTVYSTPARPLSRNTLSRGAFKFKKSHRHCSWKCTALVAVGVAVLLSLVLCYCIGERDIWPLQVALEISDSSELPPFLFFLFFLVNFHLRFYMTKKLSCGFHIVFWLQICHIRFFFILHTFLILMMALQFFVFLPLATPDSFKKESKGPHRQMNTAGTPYCGVIRPKSVFV